MLSIATLHAVDYYTDAASEAFGYYGEQATALSEESDPAGTWTGELAQQFFGANRTVQKADFAALFFGFDPRTRQPLTKSADALGFAAWQAEQVLAAPNLSANERREARQLARELRGKIRERESAAGWRGHRAGIDLTFSAPKDFSLLVAAASPDERKALLAAWRRSVESTLITAEQRYAKTRLRDEGGKLRKERIVGAAIALFEHIAARPVGDSIPDPDAHLHAVLMSPVLCHDSATRALFSNDLRLNLKVLDAEARARLAQELQGMGYGLIEDRQKNCTSFHLAGIAPETRAQFSKRRNEIVAGLAAGKFQTAAVAAMGTRQGKGDWTRATSLAAWQKDFSRIGLTADYLKEAKAQAEPHARSDQEIIASLLEMKSYFSAREVRQALWEEAQFAHVPADCIIGDWIDARANQLLKSSDLLEAQLPDGSTASRQRTAAGDEEPVFTTRSLLLRELKLDDAVQALGKAAGHRIEWQTAKAIVEAQEEQKTADAKAEAMANGKPLPDGFRWSYRDDQKAAIEKVLAGPDIGFIDAKAGTGKTTSCHAIIEVYRAMGMKVIALAPSNKAAGQLSEDCKLEGADKAMTVDAFLLSKKKDSVDANTVIVVDESSMLSFDSAEALVNISRKGGKLICQGDVGQLPSVARGRWFANCIEKRLGTESAELTIITRQREEWARAAIQAAARGDFATTMAMLDEHQLIHTEGTDEAVLERIARDHLADPQPASQKLIVASRNADVAALNQRIRRELVASGQVEKGLACMAGKERNQAMMVGVGDRLIFTDTLKSGREKIAVNGAIGTVQSVSVGVKGIHVLVQIDGQRKPVEFDTTDFSAFQHAYAISIHKSQGATTENCRYLFSDFVSSELAYVGMSRHRATLGLYCREDQKQDLARHMGKRIEKLDARDLVSVDELNQAAATLRAADEGLALSARRYLQTRLPALFRRAVAVVVGNLPDAPKFSMPAAAINALERLRQHQKRLAHHSITKPHDPHALPLPPIADKLAAWREVKIMPHHSKESPRP